MEYSFEWKSESLEPIVAIACTVIGFITYWFLAESKKLRKAMEKKYGEEKTMIYWVLFQKYTGFLFLGIIPTIVVLSLFPYSLGFYGMKFTNMLQSLYWILGLGAIVIPMNFFAARRPQTLAYYPQIRTKVWDTKLILLNGFTWIAYLFAYEFLFRGILLFLCVPTLGVWNAIAVNTAIYSCTHIPKGAAETIGAIPFGILICIITLMTGTFWVGFMVHSFLALSNDYVALYFNPETKIVRSK